MQDGDPWENQGGPLGVPQNRHSPVSTEEGHTTKGYHLPLSSSSSPSCYRNWTHMKQTKSKQKPPDLKCLHWNLNQTAKAHSSHVWHLSSVSNNLHRTQRSGPYLRIVRTGRLTCGWPHTPAIAKPFRCVPQPPNMFLLAPRYIM